MNEIINMVIIGVLMYGFAWFQASRYYKNKTAQR
jgi:hypothetical protein